MNGWSYQESKVLCFFPLNRMLIDISVVFDLTSLVNNQFLRYPEKPDLLVKEIYN